MKAGKIILGILAILLVVGIVLGIVFRDVVGNWIVKKFGTIWLNGTYKVVKADDEDAVAFYLTITDDGIEISNVNTSNLGQIDKTDSNHFVGPNLESVNAVKFARKDVYKITSIKFSLGQNGTEENGTGKDLTSLDYKLTLNDSNDGYIISETHNKNDDCYFELKVVPITEIKNFDGNVIGDTVVLPGIEPEELKN